MLHYWTGLGYYARARNLHEAAAVIAVRKAGRGGAVPADLAGLCALPGIGRSTAAAILALSRGASHPILDGNARRVLSRCYAVHGDPGTAAWQRRLWALAAHNTPAREVARYTQGIMDLGATVCLRRAPLCEQCPVADRCRARRRGIQEALPAPRKRRPLPVKAVCMVLVHDERRRVLLEQRPAPGIWGGLWAPPECEHGEEIRDALERRYGLRVEAAAPGPMLRHAFTHYVLEITPVRARLVGGAARVMESRPVVWYNPAQPQRIGLAAPVLKLLESARRK